jgi:hypothetical protein
MKERIFYFLILFFVSRAGATELYEYNVSTRAHGMGGVYAPFPDETDAIFVNPAYLSQVHEIGWDLANAQAGINGLQNYQTFQSLSGASGTSSYSSLYGKSLWVGGNGRSSVVFPFFGFAIYDDFRLQGELNQPSFPDFNVGYINDTGFEFGFGFPLDPIFSFGATLKRIQRTGGISSIGLSTISAGSSVNIQNQFQNSGSGYGADLALMAKVPMPFSPTLVAVWKDVGSTQFTQTGGADNPPRLKDNLILGSGISMDLPGLDVRLGAEYHNVTDTGIQLGNKLHFGTEVSLPLIDVRAGLSQGYQSYGAGINLWFLKVDAAYYTVERGDYPGQTPDLRIEASVSLQLSVDADFTFTSKDGKKRKLKQRR